MSGLDVDTRSDVYSLGVLLYELLTGTTPFDKERLKQAAFDEIRRIIREEEPPRPSTRLSTLGETLATVSAQPQDASRSKLGQLVRGELDWIVMKALEKDRNRRYETANGLARGRASATWTTSRCRRARRRRGTGSASSPGGTRRALATVAALAVAACRRWRRWRRAPSWSWQANKACGIRARPGSRSRPGAARGVLPADHRGPPRTVDRQPGRRPAGSSRSVRRTCARGSGITSCGSAGSSRWSCGTGRRSTAWRSAPTASASPPRAGTGPQDLEQQDGRGDPDLPGDTPMAVVSVAFHPDGKHLASVGADGG